jgi:hypothetical protein
MSEGTTRGRSQSVPPPVQPQAPVTGRERSQSLPTAALPKAQWLKRVLEFEAPQQADDLPLAPQQVQQAPEQDQQPPLNVPVNAPIIPPRPAQLQQAIAARLMTFDQLAEKIGHQPHQDRTFKNPLTGNTVTVRKRSTNYKEVQVALAGATNAIATTGKTKLDDFDPDQREEIENELNTQLDALRDAARAYQAQHKKNRDKSAAAGEFIDSIDAYQAMLKTALDAILDDPAFDTVKGRINLDQAIQAEQCGINFADCRFDDHNDGNAIEINDDFGSGMVNKVSKIKYTNGDVRVFKKEKPSEENLLGIAATVGIDARAVRNGNRNIASSAVADLLGVSVMPKVSYGLHKNATTDEDEIGLMMSLAPGVTPLMTNPNNPMSKMRRQLWTDNTKPSPTAQAKLQQQLNALDWCDSITGQQDRHGSNYMVDIQGDNVTVTGIDNDVAFGAGQPDANCSKNSGMGYYARTTPPGLPPLIDKPTYDSLIAGDFDRDLVPKLKTLLAQEELAAAKSRFNQVKQHAQGLHPNFVVTDWQAWRSPPPDFLTSKVFLKQCGTGMIGPGVGADSSGGLFGRDFAAMFEKDGIL